MSANYVMRRSEIGDGRLYKIQDIIYPHPAVHWNFIARIEKKSEMKYAEKTNRQYGRVLFKEIDNDSVNIKAVVFSEYLKKKFFPLKVNGVYKIVNAGVNKGFPDPVNNQAQLVLKKGTKIIPIECDTPSAPKKTRLDYNVAAGCSHLIEPSIDNDAIDPSLLHVLTDLNKLNGNQTVGTVAVIKEILHNDTWGYPKCKINPHCDQEMHFDENEKLWGCSKCEEKTHHEFKWDPRLRIKIFDGATTIIASCDSRVAENILGVSTSHIGTLASKKETGKLDDLAKKAAFQHFLFELSTREKGAGFTVRVNKLQTPTSEQTALLFSKLCETIDGKSTMSERVNQQGLPEGIVIKFESLIEIEEHKNSIQQED